MRTSATSSRSSWLRLNVGSTDGVGSLGHRAAVVEAALRGRAVTARMLPTRCRRMKVKSFSTAPTSLCERSPSGAGDRELKRRRRG